MLSQAEPVVMIRIWAIGLFYLLFEARPRKRNFTELPVCADGLCYDCTLDNKVFDSRNKILTGGRYVGPFVASSNGPKKLPGPVIVFCAQLQNCILDAGSNVGHDSKIH